MNPQAEGPRAAATEERTTAGVPAGQTGSAPGHSTQAGQSTQTQADHTTQAGLSTQAGVTTQARDFAQAGRTAAPEPLYGGATGRRITVRDIAAAKARGEKWPMLTAYDALSAHIFDEAGIPVLLVGDIDRGGVFAQLVGTLAVLDAEDQRHVAAFLINKFRGDATVLAPGLEMLYDITGRRSLGTLPWREGLWLDAEDSLALQGPQLAPAPPVGRDTLDVVVLRLRHISNFTDLDALAAAHSRRSQGAAANRK